ncbi:DNA-binding response regulator (plasmid) [Fulvitalea axinellae]|uniref:DNA-binding response regulator n=1 Tax=Fulvitalea axinellae TaxID=1182444 RepID=A0AAU9DIG5_9BACT|nr:DNA-binding response regulator [Fulvitalea axinellae]
MEHKIRCIIVDDEPIAIDYLSDYVQKTPQLQLVGTFNRAKEAYESVAKGNVDLLFLDIHMPGLSGLDFLRTLTNPPQVVLTTAYSEYALESYSLNVTDYLLKPIGFERFAQAINKVAKALNQGNKLQEEPKRDYLFLKSGYKSVKVPIGDILYVESMKVYVIFHTVEGLQFVKNERLKHVEALLKEHNFIRVHKSFMVSMDHITAFYGNTIEIGETEIPLGRSYREEILRILDWKG